MEPAPTGNLAPRSIVGKARVAPPEMPRTGTSAPTGRESTGQPIVALRGSYAVGTREHLLEMAELWALAGCHVHPARADGSKVPLSVPGGADDIYPPVYGDTVESGPRRGQPEPRAGQPHPQAGEHKYGWKRVASGACVYRWQEVLADLRGEVDGIGIFCGSSSGELEMIELEGRVVHLLDTLAARARELGIEELWQRLERGCSETSPSGGIHWIIRVVDGPANGNTKLAMRLDPDDPKKTQVLAETRGQGGWVVVAGSFGRTHKSGKPYALRSGSPLTIPRFTVAERAAIYRLFGTIDELPEVTKPASFPKEITRRDRPAGELLPGDDFEQRGTWHDVLPSGWVRISSGGKCDSWSMHGAGGRKTADLYHESDTLYIYDTDCPGSQRKLSKFSALAWLRHNGDFRAAAAELYAAGYGSRVESSRRPDPVEPPPALRVEHLEQDDDETISLDDWRGEAAAFVARVIANREYGYKLLRGDCGSGKTYTVGQATSQLRRGVTSAPSHELCGEIVEQLRSMGADAAAFPQLDETTCRNWGNAQRALAAGLPVAACVCGGCPLKRECREDGYLAGVRDAGRAAHVVVTHERLARTAHRLCKRAEYVTVEEDPSQLLRPSRTATARALARVADLVDELAEAERRQWILEGADLVVEESGEAATFAEFDAWAGEEHADAEPTPAGDDEQTRQRTYPAGFLGRVGKVAAMLAERCRAAVRGGLAPGMHAVDLPPTGSVPRSPERVVWRALEALRRIDPHGTPEITADVREALTLAIYAACGRLDTTCVQVEHEADHVVEDAPTRSARVVGYWRVYLPADRIPVFVTDATCDGTQLEQLVGRWVDQSGKVDGHYPVEDITPTGRLELLQTVEHYPVDISRSTSPRKVAAIITGIVRARPHRQRVGLVLLKTHYDRLLCPGDEPHLLPIDVWDRIEVASYHGSGVDRGSNRFHKRCDLLIVIGTHRPPPKEIRRRLVQLGELEAANALGTWGSIERHAVTPDGTLTTFRGRGYAEEVWARAADSLTRATMRQSGGRGRPYNPDGCDVVICTTERLGFPVVDPDLLPVADERVDRVVAAVADACPVSLPSLPTEATFARESLRESGRSGVPTGATLEQIVVRLPGVPDRTLRRWIARAVEGGQLVRSGSTTATRYTLAADVVPPVAPPAVSVVPLVEVPVLTTPPPSVVPPEPVIVLEHLAPAPPPTPEPEPEPDEELVPTLTSTPDLDDLPEEEWWPWLAAAVDPSQFPREVEDLRFQRANYAIRLGDLDSWNLACTPELVPKLAAVAEREARRRKVRPPPIEVVARHTTAWAIATPDTWGAW